MSNFRFSYFLENLAKASAGTLLVYDSFRAALVEILVDIPFSTQYLKLSNSSILSLISVLLTMLMATLRISMSTRPTWVDEWKRIHWKTSDAGSQYRCGRVGRGIQPPSTPHAPPLTHIYKKHLKRSFFHFSTLSLWTNGQSDGLTDGRMDRQTDGCICVNMRCRI